MTNVHNHGVSSHIMKFKDVDDATKRRLCELFAARFSPAEALAKLKKELNADCASDSEFCQRSADRSELPDYQYICRYVFLSLKTVILIHVALKCYPYVMLKPSINKLLLDLRCNASSDNCD